MRLRNRISLPPITTNYGTPEGRVTKAILQFYGERAKDVGLVIVEATATRADGRIVPRSLGLWEDAQMDGMALLAHAIRERGAAAVVQINHAGARCVPSGGVLQGASPSGFAFRPDVVPFSMSQGQIDRMVADFGDAARRAMEAGFQGVEIHGAHFYLMSQFLSPLTNRRTDTYGGDAGARTTFALDVISAVRKKVGRGYPVLFRLNAVENVEGGQTIEDALTVGRLVTEAGVDALHVSVIAQSSWRNVDGRRFLAPSSALSKDAPFGANLALAARFKEVTNVPVISVGKLGNAKVIAEAILNGQADVVAIGRQMVADPDTAGKVLSGQCEEIIPCKECMNCFASIVRGAPMACTVNKNLPQDPVP